MTPKGYYVSERFEKAITLHIVRNLIPESQNLSVPLILGIHGQTGEGKTFQTQLILKKLRVKEFLISGGQLESHAAGKPANLVGDVYTKAGEYVRKGKRDSLAVVLINDIDTGVGNWGEMVQYTVNRQTVFGELMHLVDYPRKVRGKDTQRIPIIITGNDFSKLYKPLIRAGRMVSFQWEATLNEKFVIVSGIFPELSENEIKKFVNDFREQPISFFSHVRVMVFDEMLWEQTKLHGVKKVISDVGNGLLSYSPDFEMLVRTGRQIVKSGFFKNHLDS